jgi:hypothetical protein
MKRFGLFAAVLVAAALAFLLAGCNSGSDDDFYIPPPADTFLELENLTFNNTTDLLKYYSLTSGEEVDSAEANATNWDIAIERHASSMLVIYTNSGDTAAEAGSSGDGGVWFTEKNDFDDVNFDDRVTDFSGDNAEYAPYVTDVSRWLSATSSSAISIQKMNVMTYFGYVNGDGLASGTSFGTSGLSVYAFNKKAAYYKSNGSNMPPQYAPTRRVYIIRHADGSGYSKFQVSALSFSSPTYTLTIKIARLE